MSRKEIVELIQVQLGCNYLLIDLNDIPVKNSVYYEAKKSLGQQKRSYLRGKVSEETFANQLQIVFDEQEAKLERLEAELESFRN